MRIMIKTWVVLLVVGIYGCKEKKSVVINPKIEDVSIRSQDTNKLLDILQGEVAPNVKKIDYRANFPKEQLAIINRNTFNRSVLTFDTTNLSINDTVPFRLLSRSEIYTRMPRKKKIGDYILKSSGRGYANDDDDNARLKSLYPGVLLTYNINSGYRFTEIGYYNESGEIIKKVSLVKESPYLQEGLLNIEPGQPNFEIHSWPKNDKENYGKKNFKKVANSFLLDIYAYGNWGSPYVIVNHSLTALNSDNTVIGYEATTMIYNEIGEVIYTTVLPFKVGSPRISSDNRYFLFAPERTRYMPNAYNVEGELFIVDLKTSETIYTKTFNDKDIKFNAFREYQAEDVFSCSFNHENRNKRKSVKYIHFIIDPKNQIILKFDISHNALSGMSVKKNLIRTKSGKVIKI